MKNSIYFLILCTFSILTLLFNTAMIQAADVNSAQTKGNIEFYGEFISESEPDPVPPTGFQEKSSPIENDNLEGGHLPKSNQLYSQGWRWLGIVFIALAYYHLRRKHREASL